MKRILAYRIQNGPLFRDGVLEFDTMKELDRALADMKKASEEFGGSLTYARFWRS